VANSARKRIPLAASSGQRLSAANSPPSTNGRFGMSRSLFDS
jgi:hypothetical protein